MLPDERPALRGFVARLIGFAPERAQAVEHALQAIELATTYQAALVLCGDGDLVPVARGVHRHALGDDRPVVLCDPQRRDGGTGVQLENRRTAADAIGAATGGTVCVRVKWLPRYLAELVAAVHAARVRLVICGLEPPKLTELVLAPIKVPALATRAHELDRIIDEYAHDAAVALQISEPLTETDRHWVRAHSATSLPEVEKGAWRMLALRKAGNIAGAAALLGMGYTSLGEWLQRRRGSWRGQNGVARSSPPVPCCAGPEEATNHQACLVYARQSPALCVSAVGAAAPDGSSLTLQPSEEP